MTGRHAIVAGLLLGTLSTGSLAAQVHQTHGKYPTSSAATAKPSPRTLSDAEYIKAAELGAPAALRVNARVVKIDAKGTVQTLRNGTNHITCLLGVPGDEEAPFCGDEQAFQWMVDAIANNPKPTNTTPGIAYMAKGGKHFETASGELVMHPGANTVVRNEPPHWMLTWPIDATTSGLPTKENPSGAYIMFAGTPYAHLMVYQNPNQMNPAQVSPAAKGTTAKSTTPPTRKP